VTFAPASGVSALEIVEASKELIGQGAVMRALVIYESMYGNTHQIAEAISAGLAGAFDVAVVPVAEADQAALAGADLVVVGGPTHVHGMARPSTRQAAEKAASEPGGGVTLEPDALKTGLREWLDSLGKSKVHARAAAFDTRIAAPAALTGRASKAVGKALRHHGYDLVAEPESFLVTKENQLVAGEIDRARQWGAKLATICVPVGATSRS
jgi:flavodoxin-like protein